MAGSLKQNDSGRDDGCYVMNGAGLNVGNEFYFYLPDGVNSEKEVKINTYSQSQLSTYIGGTTINGIKLLLMKPLSL
jgi:hypothetical protein